MINLTSTNSGQNVNGIVTSITENSTSIMNSSVYGISNTLSYATDMYSVNGGYFSATVATSSHGINTNLALGVDAIASSSMYAFSFSP
jgi:hypothetical protein